MSEKTKKYENELPEIVKPKIDVVFKKLFGDPENIHILKGFVSAVLNIPKEDIKELVVENGELLPEYADEKFGRVDLKITLYDGRKLNIELQACWYQDYKDRTLFYWSRMFTYGFKKGMEYRALSETICVNIVGFNVFECNEYHSHFKIKEIHREEYLNDKLSIHFYELKKLPQETEENRYDSVLQWLRLINAETEEDLNMSEKSDIPEIRDAVTVVRTFSADEQMRINAFEREMAMFDHLAEISAAKRDGRLESDKKYKRILEEAERKADEAEIRADNEKSRADSLAELARKYGIPEEQIAAAEGRK